MNKISVIIPVYNSEKYLAKCVDSIINQTYQNLEIILIDDGSTDTSTNLCDNYAKKDNRIKVIHKNNGGTASARNTGIENSSGDFLYFIDSDDYIKVDTFEYLLNILLKNNADISFAPYTYVNEKYEIIERKRNEDEKIKIYNNLEAMDSFLDWKIPCCICDKLFKKDLFVNIRLKEGYLCEDLNIVYKLLANSKRTIFSNKSKYFYVSRETSQMRTSSGFDKLINSITSVIDEMIDFYKKNYPKLYEKAICYGLDEFFIYYASISNKKTTRIYKHKFEEVINKYIYLLPKKNNCLLKIKFKIFLYKINPKILSLFVNLVRKIRNFFPISH